MVCAWKPTASMVTVRWDTGQTGVFCGDRGAGWQQFSLIWQTSTGMGAADTCVKLRQVPACLKMGRGMKPNGNRSSWPSQCYSVPLPQDPLFSKFRYIMKQVFYTVV